MSGLNSWLDRLNSATNYRELQSIFTQLESEAKKLQDSVPIAQGIDEAIQRIEQERNRDRSTMEEMNGQYEAFKQEHAGIVGWFRRKIPFTATRKQELEHRESVNEQEAEILADNFFIARAQMLKQSILPSANRQLGPRAHEWRDRVAKYEGTREVESNIREFGKDLSELSNEIQRSEEFVHWVDTDIEAFSTAKFAASEDRLRKDADLEAARRDIGSIRNEISEKKTIRSSSIKLLSMKIHNELMREHPNYKTLVGRGQSIETWKGEWAKFDAIHDSYRKGLKSLSENRNAWHTLRVELNKLESELRQARQTREEMEAKRSIASEDLRLPKQNFDQANRALENSTASLNAAKRLYDAYLQEQNKAEVTGPADFDLSSPVSTEYERLQRVVADDETALRRIKPLYEAAKEKHDQISREIEQWRTKTETMEANKKSRIEKQQKLEKELLDWIDRVKSAENQVRTTFSRFAVVSTDLCDRENNLNLVRLPHSPTDQPAQPDDVLPPMDAWRPSTNHLESILDSIGIDQKCSSAERLAKLMKSNFDSISEELKRLSKTCEQLFSERCSLLVDRNVSDDIQWPALDCTQKS